MCQQGIRTPCKLQAASVLNPRAQGPQRGPATHTKAQHTLTPKPPRCRTPRTVHRARPSHGFSVGHAADNPMVVGSGMRVKQTKAPPPRSGALYLPESRRVAAHNNVHTPKVRETPLLSALHPHQCGAAIERAFEAPFLNESISRAKHGGKRHRRRERPAHRLWLRIPHHGRWSLPGRRLEPRGALRCLRDPHDSRRRNTRCCKCARQRSQAMCSLRCSTEGWRPRLGFRLMFLAPTPVGKGNSRRPLQVSPNSVAPARKRQASMPGLEPHA